VSDLITWDDSFSVGVAILDEHHRQLARLINQLSECLSDNLHSEKMVDILTALVRYAEYHFLHEENLMADAGYADLDQHRKGHLQFCEIIAETCYGVSLGIVGTTELFSYLTHWWRSHILLEDMKYKPLLGTVGNSQGESSRHYA